MDVGVDQQQIFRRFEQGLSISDTAVHGPKLAGPPVGKARHGQHDHPVGRACRHGGIKGRGRGPVGTVVVDDDDRKTAAIILPQQRADAPADDRCFVPRRYDGDYAWPVRFRRANRRKRVIALVSAPEATARRQQIDPDDGRKQSDQQFRHRR